MKSCRGCGSVLPIDAFYPHPQMADGHLNRCKECVKASIRKHRENDPVVQENDRRRYHAGKKTRGLSSVPAVVKRAQNAVNNAVRDGRLTRPSRCEWCGRTGAAIEAAHDDYTKPMDVRWLCRRCHRLWDVADPKIARLAS